MPHKSKISISAVILLVILGTSLSRDHRFDSTGTFIFLFSIALIIILGTLLFLQKEVFNAWLKFARIYIPIAAILILFSPSQRQCGLGVVCFGSDKEDMTWFLSIPFFIISIVLIVRAHRRLKDQAKATPFPTGSQKSI